MTVCYSYGSIAFEGDTQAESEELYNLTACTLLVPRLLFTLRRVRTGWRARARVCVCVGGGWSSSHLPSHLPPQPAPHTTLSHLRHFLPA